MWAALAQAAIKSDAAPNAPFSGGDFFGPPINNAFTLGGKKTPDYVWVAGLAIAAIFVLAYAKRGR